MPNIKSAIKRVKVSQTKTLRNKMVKSELKTAVKNFENSLVDSDLEKARLQYAQVVKKIDKAASKGSIHKNAANRKKAKLALRLNTATAAAQK
ncbi:MAG TPA: 30S ribosomal protein S20 [Clostridiales bacterium]|nr:30S ribosomal protein S20 [Clostridiales bacterium]